LQRLDRFLENIIETPSLLLVHEEEIVHGKT